MTDARSIIAGIRDGKGLSADDAAWFAQGLASGVVEDAQAGAFAMAVWLRGLDEAGRVALTAGMRDSGRVLDWDLPGPVLDKHSTGGVADSTSMILAPALAACGAYVPMISGRGLGHTGGTLDKLESIPGYSHEIDKARLAAILRDCGCAIIGATDDIAPADRRLYAIRDVTSTVESVDLITASILSKKLAAGLDALILDVKCGSGAFMTDRAAAGRLAQALVTTANGAGCRCAALMTDMDSPLGACAGNALEIRENIAHLTQPEAHRETALMQVTLALGAEGLLLAGLATDRADATARITRAIMSGEAALRFGRMIAALGGPSDLLERPEAYLPVTEGIPAPAGGRHVAAIDTRALGELVVRLGGGRLRQGDRIDPRVGLSGLPRVGDDLDGRPAAIIHAATPEAAAMAQDIIARAITYSDAPVSPAAPILDRITA